MKEFYFIKHFYFLVLKKKKFLNNLHKKKKNNKKKEMDEHTFLNDLSNSSTNYTFIMICLILLLGYVILLFFTCIRAGPILKRSNALVTGKIFYSLSIIFSLYRILQLSYSILKSYEYTPNVLNEKENLTRLIYNGFYISDAIFGLMFLCMFW